MEVSWNGGTPKSSILAGFSTINHPFYRIPPNVNRNVSNHQEILGAPASEMVHVPSGRAGTRDSASSLMFSSHCGTVAVETMKTPRFAALTPKNLLVKASWSFCASLSLSLLFLYDSTFYCNVLPPHTTYTLTTLPRSNHMINIVYKDQRSR